MNNESKKFSILGRTKWEKTRNIVGLLFLLGFFGSKYIHVSAETVSRVEIPTNEFGLKSKDDVHQSVAKFEFSPETLQAVATKVLSTPVEVQEKININFALGEPATLAVECTSNWPKEKVDAVCESLAADLRNHLKVSKKS